MNNKAKFQFESFIIRKSLFELNEGLDETDLSIGFLPSGKLDRDNNIFHLQLGVDISSPSETFKIEIDSIGYFKYDIEDDSKLNSYLYLNAPALLFPYLRAYISSVTTLSGIKPIVLPTLNVSSIKDNLIENIEEMNLLG